jgi:transposase
MPRVDQGRVLVEQLRTTLQAIERFDREIAEFAPRLPDYCLFHDITSAGPPLAPRLLAAFGKDRRRFGHADELQKYAGIAPVTERSGKDVASIEAFTASGDASRLVDTNLASAKVDLIRAGDPVAQAAVAAITAIPVVYISARSPGMWNT